MRQSHSLISMEKVLGKIKKLEEEEIEPNIMKTTLDGIDFAHIDYNPYLEGLDLQTYGRVYIMDAPLKVFLNIWPSQFQLSTHQHNNFWGYIAVLKGLLTETTFVFDPDDNILSCHPPKSYRKGEFIFQPLNGIHHLQNPSPSKPLVTIHLNYPAVYNYDGLRLFDIRKRKVAEMNEKANGISWDHPKDHYRSIKENAFEVVNLW
jgi:hypothetical protein